MARRSPAWPTSTTDPKACPNAGPTEVGVRVGASWITARRAGHAAADLRPIGRALTQ